MHARRGLGKRVAKSDAIVRHLEHDIELLPARRMKAERPAIGDVAVVAALRRQHLVAFVDALDVRCAVEHEPAREVRIVANEPEARRLEDDGVLERDRIMRRALRIELHLHAYVRVGAFDAQRRIGRGRGEHGQEPECGTTASSEATRK